MAEQLLWAEQAWIAGRWQQGVALEVDPMGRWGSIRSGVMQPPAGARQLPGPVLPGLVNAHSHAFQRAFAGLAERRESQTDDFWSWRERMYQVALRITPAQMRAVAAQLYLELLRGGYTQVCEFHYLHRDAQGEPYADPATMCWALADAASDAGLGITLLPVLYERAGFAQDALREDQRRFAGTPESVHRLFESLQGCGRERLSAGVAIHSLRAASEASVTALLRLMEEEAVPIHIHVAEQTLEVDECVAATGQRPIEWLCREFGPDARWQLVHATHATPNEIEAVARTGAGIILCPATEANLGDGLCDLPGWLSARVPIALGSDSHVTRNWPEELRWLEYGQRLLRRQRNVAAAPELGQPSTAARLFDAAQQAGGRSAGFANWGLLSGARADALVLDPASPALLGIAPGNRLDALVFAGGEPAMREVLVGGQRVLQDGHHPREATIAANFIEVMESLWGPQHTRP